MAFLIPDNAKSRRDIPNAVRRTISAFQVGLDDAATVWYEPLYDPSGEKPHLVVLLPDQGIAVLEVLDAKTSGVLGALRGKIRLVRDGREIEVDNPLVRAERLASILRERMVAEQRLEGLNFPVSAGAVFPYITADEYKSKGIGRVVSPEKSLMREEIDAAIEGAGEAKLLRAFQQMFGQRPEEPASEEVEKILRGVIQPETVIDRQEHQGGYEQLTIFRPPEDGEDIIRVMDRQQEAMAKSLGEGHRVIRGVAGSGKTLVLMCRAKILSKVMPNDPILVTCYTRSLAGQLRAMLTEYSNVDVIHLDKLMADYIRSARMRHPGYQGDDAGEQVALVALTALEKVPMPRYRAVLLDEAQDFGTNALRFAVSLLQPDSQDLVIVADAAQNIFRRKFSWKDAGIQAQGRTRILRTNYRNTREILDFASRFLFASTTLHADDVPDMDDENAVISPEAASRSGPSPVLTIGGNVQDEVARVVTQVKEWSRQASSPKGMAILYGAAFDDGKDRARLLYDRLKAEGLNVFWISNPNDRNARDRLAEVDAPIVLSTIHSAKGLEFPYVVMCGVWREGESMDINRKLAYVGMTRATDHLAVVTRDGHPLVQDLKAAAG